MVSKLWKRCKNITLYSKHFLDIQKMFPDEGKIKAISATSCWRNNHSDYGKGTTHQRNHVFAILALMYS